jgi:3-phosphoshikimate 1-carboxyvinyltransferase
LGADAVSVRERLTRGNPARPGRQPLHDQRRRDWLRFLVLGMAAEKPGDDRDTIATSFPEFVGLMTGLGGEVG